MGFPDEPRDGSIDAIPISTGYVPNVGFVAIQSSPTTNTDGSGNVSSPVDLNLKQIGDVVIALGQAVKNASIPVTLASDQGTLPVLDTNSAAIKADLDAIKAAVQGTLGVGGAVSVSNFPAIQRVDAIAGDFPAGSIVDLATLAAIVSGGKGAVKAGAGDFADLATLAGIVSSNKAAVKAAANDIVDLATLAGIVSSGKASVKASANDIVDLATLAGIVSGAKAATKAATNDIVDLATLLARHTDTFGNNTTISAATTFGTIPLVSVIAASSSANLTNNGYQDTFIAQINVASAFVGTIGFYGLLPDGTTLQQINAHQRGTATNGNSTAINTGSALEQTWEGSIAGFKAIYVVCTAFTSGAASVQLGLTAANYAHAIINTVASNLTQLNGTAPQLDGGSSNRLGVSLYGKSSAAGDTPLGVDASGRITAAIQAVLGTALAADQTNSILRISNYVTKSVAGDTALTLGQATMANSLPVTNASDQTPLTTSTATKTSVAGAASDTSLLASNTGRKGATFYNDSTAILYLSYGSGAASTSSYTVQIPANGFFELPPAPIYTGAIRGIWSAANGNVRISELS